MGILVSVTAGLVLWVVLWALDVKAFDAFMLFLLIVLGAVAARMISPYLPGNRGKTTGDGPSRYR